MTPEKRYRVAIVYPHLPEYRLTFFQHLRDSLRRDNISLDLYYGKTPTDTKGDERDLDWAIAVRNRVAKVMGRQLIWQPLPPEIEAADMVILLQNTSVVSNLWIASQFWAKRKKVAFWGHGINYQSSTRDLANLVKRIYTRRADWFFAYTRGVRDHLLQMGFPESRITIVQNAIDTRSLVSQFEAVDAARVEQLRRDLRLSPGPVGLFCGGMYDLKRLPFLIEAAHRIRQRIPSFQMLFLGSGIDAGKVRAFAETAKWVRYIGPKFGEERVPYFKLADVFLMPGLVGLAVLDSFALQTPMVTTRYPYHSPEIDYLESDYNGLLTDDNVEAFAEGVVHFLTTPKLSTKLKQGCSASAFRYTNEAMVDHFRGGIRNALAAP